MGILENIKNVFTGEKSDISTRSNPTPEPKKSSPELYLNQIEAKRAEKDRFFRSSPHSPIEDRASFTGLDYFPPDLDYRYTLPLQPAEQEEELTIQTNTGDEQIYYRLGTVEFEVEGETARLAIYRSPHHDELFLPFRDATSGQETYSAGRYLEPHAVGGDQVVIDFNLSYNPFCAYSESYSCPLPPAENHLKVPIRAGEKNYEADQH